MAKSSAPRAQGHDAASQPPEAAAEERLPGAASGTRSILMELLKRAGETDVASLARELGISGV
ncbi:MAG: hypothetical protein ACFFEM_13635, partial [Candidatus Thorarchaeota archaeon]